MTNEGLKLKLHVPDGPVPLDRDVVVKVVLANRSDAPMLVNGRLLAAPRYTPEPFREITFQVNGPSGYVNRKRTHINAGKPGPEHFIELASGDDIVKEFELTNLESLNVPGPYAVKATYGSIVIDPALPRQPWLGTVSSEWSTIERT